MMNYWSRESPKIWGFAKVVLEYYFDLAVCVV